MEPGKCQPSTPEATASSSRKSAAYTCEHALGHTHAHTCIQAGLHTSMHMGTPTLTRVYRLGYTRARTNSHVYTDWAFKVDKGTITRLGLVSAQRPEAQRFSTSWKRHRISSFLNSAGLTGCLDSHWLSRYSTLFINYIFGSLSHLSFFLFFFSCLFFK